MNQMSTGKTELESLSESTHPYAVRVELTLGSNIELLMQDSEILLQFAEKQVIRIVKERPNNREQANFLKRISVYLEAFSTACEAEQACKMLALSLLWVAASMRVTLTFDRWTGNYPFSIRDRTRAAGLEGRAEGHGSREVRPEELHSIAEEAYKLNIDVSPQLLTSMEFYAAARLEITEQARFISLMTALEALSKQTVYDDEIAELLTQLACQLDSSAILSGENKASLKNSLSDRLKGLRRESVRQAIVRTVREHIQDEEIIQFVDKAYRLRSNILHEGLKDSDLHLVTHRLEDIIRRLYAAKLGLSLTEPTQG